MNRPNSARDWIKLALAATVETTGLGTVCRAVRTYASGARVHVLGYHRVVDVIDYDGPVNPSLCITTDAFRAQMEQLRERFVVLPMSYVVRAVAGDIQIPHDAVAVTFDDGYRDVLQRADPILRALDIPATVFVPTGFVDNHTRARLLPHDRLYAAVWAARRAGRTLLSFADSETAILLARADRALDGGGPADVVDELIETAPAATLAHIVEMIEAGVGAPPLDDGAHVLTPDEVRTLADHGWEIGAHTVGHVVLTHETPDEARRQLVSSKADLERWSGRPCRYFAYCNGYHSPSLVSELRRAGYEGAVTTCDRPNPVGKGDPFRITRKVLWEAHARGPHGRFSPTLSAAHLHDVFGALGLTKPVDGERSEAENHFEPNRMRSSNTDSDPQPPTEVELAY
ncbi:MAG: Polysaccharide deacetylase [Myxococcales bacterium]|nr:Polysaccharide deacetylase [Myxococcales bacterium]